MPQTQYPYGKPLPRDRTNKPMQLIPPTSAIATNVSAALSASSVLNLNASTTLIEVTALNQPILLKWGVTTVTATNFDNVIVAGSTRHFQVPIQSFPANPHSVVTFREQSSTATLLVTEFP